MPDSGTQVPEIPADLQTWLAETMAEINRLTPDIKGKAFDPDWFLLRQRFEQVIWRIALLTRENAALREQVERIKHPHIYTGTYYAVAKVPKICPECDCTTFVSLWH